MAVRVCYIQRGAKGDAITGVRLVAERSEETWTAPQPRDGAPITADIAAAADWLAAKLKASGDSLDVICLDTEGSLCGWLSAPSGDLEVVGALAREFGETPGHEGHAQRSALAEAASTREEASVAVLGAPAWPSVKSGKNAAQAKSSRIGVLTISDVPARLLADALDQRGVAVHRITTVWHALAAVWDPGARLATPGQNANPSVVDSTTTAPITAILTADPSGRLHWVWSSAGVLLAGGAIRIALERPATDTAIVEAGRTGSFPLREHTPHVMIAAREASRLATEWLAWSLELGRSPARIIAVTPAAAPGREREHEANLSEFGETLTRAIPGATMDLAEDKDPIGTTLTRLAERIDDAPAANQGREKAVGGIAALSSRPTRSHRRFFIMASLALASLAAAAGSYAYKLRSEAGEAAAAAVRSAESWRPIVREIDANLLNSMDTVPDQLNSRLRKLEEQEARPATRRVSEIRPVMDELATLTMVLGDPEIHLNEITLDNARVTIKVIATLEQATLLEQAFKDIAGSNLTGWSSTSSPARGAGVEGFEYTFTASWINPEPPKPAAGSKPQ